MVPVFGATLYTGYPLDYHPGYGYFSSVRCPIKKGGDRGAMKEVAMVVIAALHHGGTTRAIIVVANADNLVLALMRSELLRAISI